MRIKTSTGNRDGEQDGRLENKQWRQWARKVRAGKMTSFHSSDEDESDELMQGCYELKRRLEATEKSFRNLGSHAEDRSGFVILFENSEYDKGNKKANKCVTQNYLARH